MDCLIKKLIFRRRKTPSGMDREAYRQCLSHIFYFLDVWVFVAACVCKEWRELAEPLFKETDGETIAYEAAKIKNPQLFHWVLNKSPYRKSYSGEYYEMFCQLACYEAPEFLCMVPGWNSDEGKIGALHAVEEHKYLPLLEVLVKTRVKFRFRHYKSVVRMENLDFLKCIGLPKQNGKIERLLFITCRIYWFDGYEYILQKLREKCQNWEVYWMYICRKFQHYLVSRIKRRTFKESELRKMLITKDYIPLAPDMIAIIMKIVGLLWENKEKKLGIKKSLAK